MSLIIVCGKADGTIFRQADRKVLHTQQIVSSKNLGNGNGFNTVWSLSILEGPLETNCCSVLGGLRGLGDVLEHVVPASGEGLWQMVCQISFVIKSD